ncbi:MAG: error-prone DNA polymerase [Burkholderiales bacterium]|nr:error-prone DNA polymerase [Burkholderiales bacterium]
MQYAELHCITSFSFLRGASQPDELVERAKALGYAALAITDECTLAGTVRAHVAAREAKLPLIIGSEFRLTEGDHVVLLAVNRNGYGNLGELITLGRSRAPKGEYLLSRTDLADGIEDCLLLLVPSVLTTIADIRWWQERFKERCWIAVELSRGPDDAAWLTRLREYSRLTNVPLVAAGGAEMHARARKPLHDVISAIRLNTTVAELGRRALPNGEQHLRSLDRLAHLYPSRLLAESAHIASLCHFSMDELGYEYPEELVPPGETPVTHLRKLTEQGLRQRYGEAPPAKVQALVDRELALIQDLRYEAFFLTVEDIVREARRLGILCQGRGSAANSAVCYCLGVTEVDPNLTEVLFERFLSRERNEPPDIDVDFEHERREEIIQYIYRKYGRDRTALAATVISYRRRSALRDVGKALGLSLDQISRVTQTLAWWDRKQDMAVRLVEAGLDPANIRLRQLMHFTELLRGFPRHLSQHVGGFVIARGKLARMVPIQNAAMKDRSVIEWDKDDLEALGLLKVDVLALGMLTALRRTFEAWNNYPDRPPGSDLSMASIMKEDPATYDMICAADTVGVFQIESRAQMSMLPRLRPRKFYDLVIEVAIVRPGPIQGGMVHPYLKRRKYPNSVTYPSDALREVLERTLGVSVFQEQVMKIAEVAAGFTPGEADQLRRAMAAWKRKGGLGPFREKLRTGMLERGYKEEYFEQIFKQIEGFGEYGFPESHAASFALLAYFSAWLKRHYPAAFTCGLLNSLPMGFYSASQLVQDLKRHGVEVLPVDVLFSDYESKLESRAATPVLRLGMHLVKGLSEAAARSITATRHQASFSSVEDLAHRAMLSTADINHLASADALHNLSGHRRAAKWETLGLHASGTLLPLLEGDRIAVPLQPLAEGPGVRADYDSTGLSLRKHPLALLRPKLRRHVTAAELANIRHGTRVRTTGMVTGRQRPGTASGVVFVTLEDETGNINVIVWSTLVASQRRQLLGAKLMTVHGKLERKDGVTHVIADRMVDVSHLLGPLEVPSRDFH